MPISPEKMLISAALREGDFGAVVNCGLEAKHFSAAREEFVFLENFYRQYRRTPSKVVFKNSFPEFVIRPVNDTMHFVDEVRKRYGQRTLTGMLKEVSDFLVEDGDLDEAARRAYKSLVTVTNELNMTDDGDIFSNPESILKGIAKRKKRFDDTGSSGIPTGLTTLDDYTGGMGPGEHWVFAARQGEGKSYTMQTLAANAILSGTRVNFHALEQTKEQVGIRMYGLLSGQVGQTKFAASDLMRGRNFDMKQLRSWLREMKGRQEKGGLQQFHCSDKRRGQTGSINFAAAIEKNRPGVSFVDYLQLCKASRDGIFGHEKHAQVSEDLTALSVEYDIPICSASQLNREAANNKNAGTENLSGSDGIGNDATVVMIIQKHSPHSLFMKCSKNRNNQGGFGFYVEYRPDDGIFREISADRADDIRDEDAFAAKKAGGRKK